jgi:hypothetical protein
MIIEIVSSSVFWLNAFHAKNGISPMLSPRTIITGTTVDFSTVNLKLENMHRLMSEEHNNSMALHTTGE